MNYVYLTLSIALGFFLADILQTLFRVVVAYWHYKRSAPRREKERQEQETYYRMLLEQDAERRALAELEGAPETSSKPN